MCAASPSSTVRPSCQRVAAHRPELQPARPVPDQAVPAQVRREHVREVVERGVVGGVERGRRRRSPRTRRPPRRLVGLDEERAAVRRVGVGVRDEHAVLRAFRREQRMVEGDVRPAHRYQPVPGSTSAPNASADAERVALPTPSAAITRSASSSSAARRVPNSSFTPASSACRWSTARSVGAPDGDQARHAHPGVPVADPHPHVVGVRAGEDVAQRGGIRLLEAALGAGRPVRPRSRRSRRAHPARARRPRSRVGRASAAVRRRALRGLRRARRRDAASSGAPTGPRRPGRGSLG